MKRLTNILLSILLTCGVALGQGTGASPIAFRIGRPLSPEALRDTSLVLRALIYDVVADSAAKIAGDTSAVLQLYVQNTVEDSLAEIRTGLDSTKTSAANVVEDSLGEIRTGLDSVRTAAANVVEDSLAEIRAGLDSLPVTWRGDIADSIAAHPPSAATIDSVGHSYVIGRKLPADYVLAGADSASLGIALDTAFVKLAAVGGTIVIKGGVYALSKTDTVAATTKRINIVGERGRTQVYVVTADYAFYDTLNVGKLELGGGIEWIGTANALGLIRTGTTASVDGDSVSVTGNICRAFSNASATMFLVGDFTTAWRVENNIFQSCYTVKFAGRNSFIHNNESYSSTTFGLWINTNRNVVESNKVVDADSAGICIEKFSTPDVYRTSGVVRSNTVFRTSKRMTASGIIVAFSSSHFQPVVVEGNTIGGDATDSLGTGIICAQALSEIGNNRIAVTVTGITLTAGGDQVSVFGNKFRSCTTGISILSGCTKSGNSENWFESVGTNVSDAGTTTVAGTTRDLD